MKLNQVSWKGLSPGLSSFSIPFPAAGSCTCSNVPGKVRAKRLHGWSLGASGTTMHHSSACCPASGSEAHGQCSVAIPSILKMAETTGTQGLSLSCNRTWEGLMKWQRLTSASFYHLQTTLASNPCYLLPQGNNKAWVPVHWVNSCCIQLQNSDYYLSLWGKAAGIGMEPKGPARSRWARYQSLIPSSNTQLFTSINPTSLLHDLLFPSQQVQGLQSYFSRNKTSAPEAHGTLTHSL